MMQGEPRVKVQIDISIFTRADGSYGHATGAIEMEVVPQVRDTVSFVFARTPNTHIPLGFSGLLKVESRLIDAAGRLPVTLMLEDLNLETVEQARKVATYLESGFGIDVHVH
jgi:hypothetical protein